MLYYSGVRLVLTEGAYHVSMKLWGRLRTTSPIESTLAKIWPRRRTKICSARCAGLKMMLKLALPASKR